MKVLHLVANSIGNLMYRLPTRMRDTTLRNLDACFPQLDLDQRNSLARLSIQHTIKTVLECGKVWFGNYDRIASAIEQIEGREILDEAVNSEKGVILLAPHLGNWEYAAHYLTGMTTVTYLYQPPKNPHMDNMLKKVRTRSGASLAPTDRKGLGILLKALRKGEMVGILPDQEPDSSAGVFAPFFGIPALTMTLVHALARRVDVTIICGFARRLPDGKGFKIYVTRADSAIFDEDAGISVAALNRTVENSVNKAIEQYQWEYKRFKRRPDGSRFYP